LESHSRQLSIELRSIETNFNPVKAWPLIQRAEGCFSE